MAKMLFFYNFSLQWNFGRINTYLSLYDGFISKIKQHKFFFWYNLIKSDAFPKNSGEAIQFQIFR